MKTKATDSLQCYLMSSCPNCILFHIPVTAVPLCVPTNKFWTYWLPFNKLIREIISLTEASKL
jgi:hypothetical protein